MKPLVIAGTGHRPPKLGLDYSERSCRKLREFISISLVCMQPKEVISGMATGFDQALAEAALILKIPLTCAVAFEGMESKWPSDGKKRFKDILAGATKIHVVSPGSYAAWKFITRDKWMVDNAELMLALFDDSEPQSGTGQTVAYAVKQGRPVVNLWTSWVGDNGTTN